MSDQRLPDPDEPITTEEAEALIEELAAALEHAINEPLPEGGRPISGVLDTANGAIAMSGFAWDDGRIIVAGGGIVWQQWPVTGVVTQHFDARCIGALPGPLGVLVT